MDHKKIYVTKQMSLDDAFNKADTFARLYNVEVAVLAISSDGRPYLFGNKCFESVVGQKANLRKERNSTSLRHSRIVKKQAKLDRLTNELERNKERGKVLMKMLEETIKKFDMKDIENQSLEELLAFKKKVEMLQAFRKKYFKETGGLSQFMPSKNKKI